jgi:hypothetical protein
MCNQKILGKHATFSRGKENPTDTVAYQPQMGVMSHRWGAHR